MLEPSVRKRTHAGTVTSVAVHPDGVTVASGELGERPVCYVWNSRTRHVTATLSGFHVHTLSSLCFSADGAVLASVGCGPFSVVAMHEWASGMLMAESEHENCAIAQVCCNRVTGSFLSVGQSHAVLWRLNGRNLSRQGCALRRARETLMAGAFLGATERQALAVTAGASGEVCLWRDDRMSVGLKAPVACVRVHEGPVYGLTTEGVDALWTCSKDGQVARWAVSEEQGLVVREKIAVVQESLPDTDKCSSCNGAACVRSIHRFSKDSLLLALGSGILCLVQDDSQASADQVRGEAATVVMEGLARQGVRALTWHPSLPLVATVGHEGAVKVSCSRQLHTCWYAYV
jgi:WD40 repeat protein